MTVQACSTSYLGDSVELVMSSSLGAAAEVASAVQRGASTSEVLELIAAKVAHATGHTMALVMSAEDGALQVAASSGVSERYVESFAQHLMTTSGDYVEAPTSQALRSRRPVVASTSWLAFPDGWERRTDLEGIRSMLSLPLQSDQGVTHAINIYCTTPHCFNDPMILDAESLANIISLLLDIHLATTRRAVEDFNQRCLVDALQQKCVALRQNQNHVDLLHRLVSAGAGIEQLVAELQRLSGATFEVSNSFGQVLVGPTALERAKWTAHTEMHRDVIVGGELVATVRMHCDAEHAARTEVAGLLHTAPSLIAIVLQREWAALDAETRLRGDLVQELLTGPTGNESGLVSHTKARWGIDLSSPLRIVLARVTRSETATRATRSERPLLSAAEQFVRRTSGALLVAEYAGHLVLLCDDGPEQAGVALAEPLRRELKAYAGDAKISVAVGDRSSSVADLRDTYHQAVSLLNLLSASDEPERTIGADDLGLARLLLGVKDPRDLIEFADRILGPLQEYDARRGASLVATLAVYLAHGCNAQITGRQLHLHANSVGYRLKRITEILGLANLSEPRVLLRLELAMAISQLNPGSDDPPSDATAPGPFGQAERKKLEEDT